MNIWIEIWIRKKNTNTEGKVIFKGYFQFLNIINRRFYSCLDYLCKKLWKTYVYTMYLTEAAFVTRGILFNGIFSIFSLARFIKLIVHSKLCQRILKQLLHVTEILFFVSNPRYCCCVKVSGAAPLFLSNYNDVLGCRMFLQGPSMFGY